MITTELKRSLTSRETLQEISSFASSQTRTSSTAQKTPFNWF
ncbi:unnamed protein product [Brassica oleracea]